MSDTGQRRQAEVDAIKAAFEQRVFEYHSDLHEALYLKSTGMKLHQEVNDTFKAIDNLVKRAELDGRFKQLKADKAYMVYNSYEGRHAALTAKREKLQ